MSEGTSGRRTDIEASAAAAAPTTDPADAEQSGSATARRSITVAAWTLISRLTGLLRIVVIGAVLGPTLFANAFLSANTVPNLVYSALAGPIVALVVVPALVRSLTERGLDESSLVLGRVCGYLLTAATATAVAVAAASPLAALALTSSVADDTTRTHAWKLTTLVVVFVAPQIIGYTVASIGAAVQQARGRFALAAGAPSIENFGLIATMAVVAIVYEPGIEVLDVPLGMVLMLGIGATLSVAAHAATQMYGAHRVGLPIRVRRGWRSDPATMEIIQRLRRSVIVAAFPSASMFVMLAVAFPVPGGVFVFQAAMSVYFVVAAIGAKSVTVAVLPEMSAAARHENPARFGNAWRQALSFSVTPGLPAMCLLIAFAEPVAATLANGELHDPQIIRWLTACLAVFAVAQLADAVNEVAKQALFARLDVQGPRLVSTVTLGVRLLVALGALLLPPGGWRLVALAGAVLVADAVAAVVALALVRRTIRPERLLDLPQLGRIGLAGAAMLPAAAVGSWLVQDKVHDRLPQLVVGIGSGGVAVVCFAVVLAWLTGQLPTLIRKVRARLPG